MNWGVRALILMGLALGLTAAQEAWPSDHSDPPPPPPPPPAVMDDADGDGIADDVDNCVDIANSPGFYVASCNSQIDEDGDGFGNACDFDFNNDGGTGGDDWIDIYGWFRNQSQAPMNMVHDVDCDGGVGLRDVYRMLRAYQMGVAPGPSGLPCAGSGELCPPFPVQFGSGGAPDPYE